jgi:hypothetical protein
VLAGGRSRPAPDTVAAEPDVVAEDPLSGFCGAVVACTSTTVTLEDRFGSRRVFPLTPGAFLVDGRPATLVRPSAGSPVGPVRSASGSIAVPGVRARTARAARIWVEGIHDAALVERVWGHDLRVEGVVVEPLDGLDNLPAAVSEFRPGPGRRVGVLADHLLPGTKEWRIASEVVAAQTRRSGVGEAPRRGSAAPGDSRTRDASGRYPPSGSAAQVAGPYMLVTGHPYVDIWQAVRPAAVGIVAWPDVPRGTDWKRGVCAALGISDTATMWGRINGAVSSFRDLDTPLITAVESLIDFVTAAP